MFEIAVSHALCFLAGGGACAIVGGIVLAHRDVRALAEREPVADPQPQPVIATGMSAYLGPIVEPVAPLIDREWKAWNTGWAGEHTTSLPVLDAAPMLAIESKPVARERFTTTPRLDRHLAEQDEQAKTKSGKRKVISNFKGNTLLLEVDAA